MIPSANVTALTLALANLHGAAPADAAPAVAPTDDAPVAVDLAALDNVSNEKILEALRQVARSQEEAVAGHQNHNSHMDKAESRKGGREFVKSVRG